jgi:hypothetical protein
VGRKCGGQGEAGGSQSQQAPFLSEVEQVDLQ